jgi:hypothetical protein
MRSFIIYSLHKIRIIRMIESRKMIWAGIISRMGRRGMSVGFWWGSRRKETTIKT